ncbi:single-stranded-DNA-specific exonuclease RecJ [Intestinibacillus massiliensis]|uniref:single-stranded-DNA-specific exonuclease RecJ n=1 Tax=Intestinibacillus massiliensis TaxID=1871029 RepID=UPI000B354A14|nr:single-stranded-DNA-specific exonuclease RecJ [Intestinibacillus massiliensis]
MKMKKWVTAQPDLDRARALCKECGFTPLAAAALCARGIDTADGVRAFLNTDPSGLHDPMRLPDMARAVAEIRRAMDAGEKIVVFGDYDVDGVTATCVLVDFLRQQGAQCDYYIPDRVSEGYGLSCAALKSLYDDGARLVVTVDSGITALPEIAYAAGLGLRVVVTDHHECRSELPAAAAVVDPRRADCEYPFDELAGVGVAFKLVCALAGDQRAMLAQYGDLVAMGTVADVMPIVGENRIIVAAGLRQMEKPSRPGLAMLLREAGQAGRKLTSGTVSFVLAPRINAAGRLGQASRAAELFLTKDPARAQELASWLCEQNKARQTAESEILEQALTQLRREYNPIEDKVIVLAGENWHHGVIGIVSSRICDRYGCPVILIALDQDTGKGSGRSLHGFNLFEALESCEDILQKYGGHELAAGLTIGRGQLAAFKARIRAYADAHIHPGDLIPVLEIDSRITPPYITQENVEGLSALEPFGMRNAQPVFSMEEMYVEDITPISSDRHVRLTLVKDGVPFTAMLFGTGAGGCGFAQGNYVDAAFHLEINTYRGKKTVQLVLKDVRLSACEMVADQKLLEIYNRYMNDQGLTEREARILLPDRKDLVAVWRHINSRAEEGRLSVPSNALSRRVQWESKRDINIGKLFVCLDVFSESSLLSYHFKDGLLNILLKPHEGKADISGSVVLATLKSMSK